MTICGDDCEGNSKKHYHCPNCSETYLRKNVLSTHYATCMQRVDQPKPRRRRRGELKNDEDAQALVKVRSNRMLVCPMCAKILNCKSLARHLRDQHSEKEKPNEIKTCQYHAVCIDDSHGIYAVSKTTRGPQHPVHVYFRKLEESTIVCHCFNKTCSPNTRCAHIQSAEMCTLFGANLPVSVEAFTTLFEQELITKNLFVKLTDMRSKAISESLPILVEIPKKNGSSERYRWFSVFSEIRPKQQGLDFNLSRMIVTIDTEQHEMWCHCRSRNCVHRLIVKAYLCQQLQDSSDQQLYQGLARKKQQDKERNIQLAEPVNSLDKSLETDQEFFPNISENVVIVEMSSKEIDPLIQETTNISPLDCIITESHNTSSQNNYESDLAHWRANEECLDGKQIYCNIDIDDIHNYPEEISIKEEVLGFKQSASNFPDQCDLKVCKSGLAVLEVKTEDYSQDIEETDTSAAVERCKLYFEQDGKLQYLKKQSVIHLLFHKTMPDCKLMDVQFNPSKWIKKLVPKEKKCEFCGCHLRHAALLCSTAK